MFCAECGNELEEDAKFCTKCGTAIDETPAAGPSPAARSEKNPEARDAAPADAAGEPSEAAASEPPAAAEPGTLKAAVEFTKHRSRRRVPLVLLIALALTLASGVAYAAFWVYNEIVLPRIEAAQQEPAAGAEEPAVPDAGEGQPVQPQGDPQHILQLAEILSMENPADIPAFLEGQGLTVRNENPVAGASPDSGAFWGCAAADTSPFAALSADGVNIVPQSYPKPLGPASADEIAGGTTVQLGIDVMPPHGIGLFYDMAYFTIDEADLSNGAAPNCVLVNNLPLPVLDEEQTKALAESCKLPAALASFTDETEGVQGSVTAHAGFLTIDDREYCWYLCQIDTVGVSSPEGAIPSYVRSFIGCCPKEQARNAVADNALYTDAEWTAADDEGKALMLAQSIVQGIHITNGGYRTNVITGETEFCHMEEAGGENASEQYVKTWMTEEEFAAKEGPEAAERIFGALGSSSAGR